MMNTVTGQKCPKKERCGNRLGKNGGGVAALFPGKNGGNKMKADCMRICLCALFAAVAVVPCAAEKTDQFQVSTYGMGRLPVGKSTKSVDATAGGGVALLYRLPVPETIPFPVGMSNRFETEYIFSDHSEVNSWFGFSLYSGIWTEFAAGRLFGIRPELAYGIYIHQIDAPARGSDGVFVDQLMRVALAVRFAVSKQITLEISPLYSLLIEENSVLQHTGLRAGVCLGL